MRIKQRRSIVVLFLILITGSGFLLLHLEESDKKSSVEPFSDNLVASDITSGQLQPETSTADVKSNILASDAGIQSRNTLPEQMRWDDKDLEVELHPNGMESINLDGRFTHVSAAIRDENGEIQIQCFSGYTAMTDAINGKTPTRAIVVK
jgi:hypothetical protein